jgi:hypothetical protein
MIAQFGARRSAHRAASRADDALDQPPRGDVVRR